MIRTHEWDIKQIRTRREIMAEEAVRTRPAQIIGPRETFGVWLKDLWLYRNALVALCARDIRGKYKQASLGVAWALIQPLVQVALFTLVFRGVARVHTAVPYAVFALAALVPFNLFQQIVSAGTLSFVSAQGIVTKVYFPRLYTVLASTAAPFLSSVITLVILVIAMIWFRVVPSANVIVAIPMLLGSFLLAIGVASFLGVINARFRDVQHALPLIMTVFMYVSPVLYPLEIMPPRLRPLALLNPVSGLVEGFRAAITGIAPYSWNLAWGSLGISVIVFIVGVCVFERAQARLIDVL
jgi:homopolymeric O-antigen transport system permease protein